MDKAIREKLDNVWKNQPQTIKELKDKTGKKAIAAVHTDVPEELIEAAGAMAATVFGKEVEYTHADKHLQGFACSYSRTVTELAERGDLKHFDGLITPYACDTTRCLDLIFKYTDWFDFYDCVRTPRREKADGVEKYYKAELMRLAGRLSEFTGVEVTDDSLKRAVKDYNEVKKSLAILRDAVRDQKDGVKPSDYFSAVRVAMSLPPAESKPLIEEAVSFVAADSSANGAPRVVAAGKVPEPPGVIDLIQDAGLSLVEDHLVIGGRWVSGQPDESIDPWDAVVKRHLSALPFAGIWNEKPTRATYLIDRVKELKADGAVFFVQKFCEPAEIDYPGVKQELEKAGIQMLLVETDYRGQSLDALRTRVEAFAEMLKDKKA